MKYKTQKQMTDMELLTLIAKMAATIYAADDDLSPEDAVNRAFDLLDEVDKQLEERKAKLCKQKKN